MKVRVLGCSGAIARDCRTTSFLIDADVLIDAGTGVGDLTLDEMRRIDHVFLSHAHLDHIAALPLMVDAVAAQRHSPLRIYALAGTIAALKTHVFNDTIWPDFSRIPTVEAPFIHFHEIRIDDSVTVAGKTVTALPAEHTVPAVGYAVTAGPACWVYSGDTGRNAAFWQRVNQLDPAMLVIETAFSRREHELAEISQHLSPDVLASEVAQIAPGKRFPIYIMHTKPAETGQIMSEVEEIEQTRTPEARHAHPIRWLYIGQEFEL